jgi:15-cis-phytoene synthase
MSATIYQNVSFQTSRLVTTAYSTSFSIGVRCLDASIRDAIYSIYGFVRLSDEIVDTFHAYNKEKLLLEFEQQYYTALEDGISLNPILNAFQHTVKKYEIEDHLIQSFLSSMKSDLYKTNFSEHEIKSYIYGSADVVGLMCLKVFVNGNQENYERLKPFAMRLGTAFQKINFLRDLRYDNTELHRVYFPILKNKSFNESTKRIILDDINEDYRLALIGIRQLPPNSRFGVYTAFLYYKSLTKRIEKTRAEQLIIERLRVSNFEKLLLLVRAFIYTKLFSQNIFTNKESKVW